MKGLFRFLVAWVCCVGLLADTVVITGRGVASGGASPTYDVKQDYEGTGYDNGETWVENAAPNEDYTTAPAPLVGSQSWHTNAIGGEAYKTFTARNEVWVYFQANISALSDNRNVFDIRDSGDTYVTRVKVHNNGSVSITNFATTSTTSAGVITAGVTFHVWLRFVTATMAGGDSISEIYVSANSTKPGSQTAAPITAGGSTNQAQRVATMGWNDAEYIFDKIRVDDVEIGSSPE